MHGKCERLAFFTSKVQEREDTVTESSLKSILSKKNAKKILSKAIYQTPTKNGLGCKQEHRNYCIRLGLPCKPMPQTSASEYAFFFFFKPFAHI